MWFSDIYRRHLMDMHIDDWDDSFLAEFSPEEYVANLKKANIQYAMVYLQSHAGLCYFPTEVGSTHRAFIKEPDRMKRLCELCHQNGIKFVGYYSLIYNTREHDKHPEWRLLAENGKSIRDNGFSTNDIDLAFASPFAARYGHLCPNNEEYRAFIKTQIDEMAAHCDLDGLFFDMPFWPYSEYCQCDTCKRKYFEEFGSELPVGVLPDTPEAERLVHIKTKWISEFVTGITDYIKAKYPHISVEHNYASAIAASSDLGCGTGVRDACDYVGGDLYGDLYYHSFACKFFYEETKNQPFENMISRCKPGLRVHTVTRSVEQMKTNIAVAIAHHGSTMIIDAVDPVGTMDSRVYDAIGKAFEMEMPYEPYFRGTLKADVGIIYDRLDRTLFHKGENFFDNRKSCIETGKTMIANHILCGCITKSSLSNYQLIIAPQLHNCDVKAVTEYVAQGGTLLFTGAKNPELVKALLGATAEKPLDYNMVYLAPEDGVDFLYFNKKYPLPYEGKSARIENYNGRALAKITLPYTKPEEIKFASIHSNPPGVPTEIPAIIVNKVGKGTVIWLSTDIEEVDEDEYRQIFMNLISPYIKPTITSTAPETAEHTLFEDGNDLYLHTVVFDERIKSAPIAPFEVSIRMEQPPKDVALLPDNERLEFTFNGECVTFTVPKTHIFSMVKIER